jgi:hypothetical protein
MARSYAFSITCPYDGAPLEQVASGRTTGFATRSVARCVACHVEIVVNVTLSFVADDPAFARSRRATPAKRDQLARAREVARTRRER